MGGAVGQIFADAVGIAVSPLALAAVVLMLATPRGAGNGLAFVIGWMSSLLVVAIIVVLVAAGSGAADHGTTTAGVFGVKLLLGVVLLVLAVREWVRRPAPGEVPPTPGWMAALDDFTPQRSAGLAVALVVANPKNLVLLLGASTATAGSTAGAGARTVAVVVLVVIASLGVLVPFGLHLFGGERSVRLLEELKDWMTEHDATILAVLFVVLGAKYLGDGIAGF